MNDTRELARQVLAHLADPSMPNGFSPTELLPAGQPMDVEHDVGDGSLVLSCQLMGQKVWAQVWPPTDLEPTR